ncbi:PREDICTED: heat shock transcription factor, Y-linked-like [Lepidothrix coronata]|uniref:Heat shock transcription factor, Y-linked-like n=1 Tax=Lepidothrix coronata TaxID=321398 RepID=A0A6J0HPD7_9PASS|nr:PREDICTED: heat shock transcription factor, Y-linked-like [Lepidothrix coronata]XP_017675469.1 PREDICTED: heat shock transcription factor, Y-linked-like [Lepidothrix coronata]XP_017675470.1 PREDICTED: heat shock transcription factor, Y-linked-like [Lepidothrix coronata]
MEHPQVLERYKPRVGHKRRAPAASCLDEELEESCQDLRPAQGTAAGVEKEVFTPVPAQDMQVSAHRESVLAKKIWEMLESDQFRSIWWSNGGQCVAINEELFKEEVLGRAGPQRVFNTQRIETIIRQLNSYGFTKMQQDDQRSASLPEFLAEEAAVSAHSQILYYYNPCFNRAHPWLVERCRRRAALKRRAPGAAEMGERPLQKPRGSVCGNMQVSTKAHPRPLAAAPLLPEPDGAQYRYKV